MEIVNTTCVFKPGYDVFKAIDELKEAGFTKLDLALDYCFIDGHPFLSDHYLDWTQELKDYAESKGVTFYQCHGVGGPEELYRNLKDICYRAIDVARILGIRWIVMHPQEIKGKTEEIYDDFYVSENIKWFTPYVLRAKEAGVGVAIENLPWPNCNRAKPLAQIVDGLGTDNVGVCWDTGHAHINGTPPSELKIIGDRLVTLHIHDNYGTGDDHAIPYYGTYDWTEFMHTLREIGYKGEFVLEAHHQMLEAADDPDMKKKLLAEMVEVSHKLINLP